MEVKNLGYTGLLSIPSRIIMSPSCFPLVTVYPSFNSIKDYLPYNNNRQSRPQLSIPSRIIASAIFLAAATGGKIFQFHQGLSGIPW
jgi:hypothetical protein